MSNLGVFCDLKSCHLCDTCVFDEDEEHSIINLKNKMNNKIYCDGCQFLSKLKVSNGYTNFYNLYCTKAKNTNRKLIDISVPESKMTSAPCWCPCNETDNERQNYVLKKTWNDIKPQISYEDIKVGEVYHIAPYDNHPRRDILITSKSEYSSSYKVISDGNKGFSINTLFPNTLMMRFITKHKIQNIKVERKA